MAIYSHKNAKLGELEGTGYLFRDRSGAGKDRYRGVFFAQPEQEEALKAMVQPEAVQFTGTLYKRGAAGKVSSSKVKDVVVEVQAFVTVSAGKKVTFEATEM